MNLVKKFVLHGGLTILVFGIIFGLLNLEWSFWTIMAASLLAQLLIGIAEHLIRKNTH